MLGSINTGGFSKSQVDAMQDSNYFQRRGVPNVYDAPNPKAKKDTGDFLDTFVKNKLFPGFDKDKEGNTVQDRFMQGLNHIDQKENIRRKNL